MYASIPEFSQYDVWGPNSVDDSKAFVAGCIKETSTTPTLRYELAIVLKDEGLLIGGCSLKRSDDSETMASLGFAVNPDFQNNGYATEVAVALIDFGFKILGLSKVLAECDTRNIASYRVMEKAGMSRVGIKQGDREIRGALVDGYHYEIAAAARDQENTR